MTGQAVNEPRASTRRPRRDARRPPVAETRQRILEAALETFSALGFDRASTRKIAAAAGLEQGHLAYYFPSKEALWREVLETFSRRCDALLEERVTPAALADPVANARAVLPAFLHFFADNSSLTRLMLQEFSQSSPRHDWVVENFGAPIWRRLEPLFVELEKLELLSGARAAVAYFNLVGAALIAFGSAAEIRQITGLGTTDAGEADEHISLILTPIFLRRSAAR